jgi:hypothetical protein
MTKRALKDDASADGLISSPEGTLAAGRAAGLMRLGIFLLGAALAFTFGIAAASALRLPAASEDALAAPTLIAERPANEEAAARFAAAYPVPEPAPSSGTPSQEVSDPPVAADDPAAAASADPALPEAPSASPGEDSVAAAEPKAEESLRGAAPPAPAGAAPAAD